MASRLGIRCPLDGSVNQLLLIRLCHCKVTVLVAIVVIGLAIFALVYRRAANSPNPQTWAVTWLVLFLIFIVAYTAFFDWTTESPPAEHNSNAARVQIGFGMIYRCLTEEARNAVQKAERGEIPLKLDTPSELMQFFRVWGGKHAPSYVWQRWTIITAGFILILLFLLSFVAWSSGMGYLLRAL